MVFFLDTGGGETQFQALVNMLLTKLTVIHVDCVGLSCWGSFQLQYLLMLISHKVSNPAK